METNNGSVRPQKIFEKVSLTTIITHINEGVTGVNDLENIIITSEDKPGIFIKYITFDITDLLTNGLLDADIKNKISGAEVEFNDFVVFTIEPEEKVLLNMSLFEYIFAHKDDTFLLNPIWDLIDIKSDNLTEINIENNLDTINDNQNNNEIKK